jgi:hypothetical protein
VLEVPVQACRREEQANPLFHSTLRRDDEGPGRDRKVVDPMLPGKSS